MFIDPQAGDYSASRFCLVLLIICVLVFGVADVFFDKVFSAWSSLALIVGSVAGVYGLSTGLRVWRNKVIKDDKHGDH
jgi:hypothetical protein